MIKFTSRFNNHTEIFFGGDTYIATYHDGWYGFNTQRQRWEDYRLKEASKKLISNEFESAQFIECIGKDGTVIQPFNYTKIILSEEDECWIKLMNEYD